MIKTNKTCLSIFLSMLIIALSIGLNRENKDESLVKLTPKQELFFFEQEYCQELDKFYTDMTGQEIDADAVDTANAYSMEEYIAKNIGDEFYIWRCTKSKCAWDYDVVIARYAY